MSVEIVHWNPRAKRVPGPIGSLLPRRPPVNNFGDLLGPMIVNKVLVDAGAQKGFVADMGARRLGRRRLLSVGSIIRLARDGDVVWGSGVNGKSLEASYNFRDLDVRAVRGPLTREFLMNRGVSVPEVFGDPGLLVGHLWARDSFVGKFALRDVTLIPNLHDVDMYRGYPSFWHPCNEVNSTIARIATSRLVVGSSLHAIILAESFGIPARLIESAHEPDFKYLDYYLGTGRAGFQAARTYEEAVSLGGETTSEWTPAELLEAFPFDLWDTRAF